MILFTLRTSLIQLPLSPEHLSPTTPVTVCSTYVGLLSASELSFISFSQSIKCASPLCLKCFPSGTQISILKEFLTLESKLILLLNTQSFPFNSSLVLSTCMLCSVASVVSDSLDPMDCSPPGSSAIFQAGILEWVAIPPQGIFPTQGSNLCPLCLLH